MANALTVSLLTARGMGAMAVVRLVGDDAVGVLRSLFVPKSGVWPEVVERDRLMYGRFVAPSEDGELAAGETIDDGIVVVRDDPRGGHVVDLTVHGGVCVVQRLCLLLQQAGAKLDAHPADVRADSSELDVAVSAALARSKTRRAVRFVAQQRIALPSALERIACVYERDIDKGHDELAKLIHRSHCGRYLIDGARVVFCGPTNAGKSTLINRLFGRAQSLVSARAGTTRDWVDAEVAVDGIPLRVIDTAGWRPNADPLERKAIASGLEQLRTADIQVVVVDGSDVFADSFFDRVGALLDPKRSVIAMNKADIEPVWQRARLDASGRPVSTSGHSGEGTEALLASLSGILSIVDGQDAGAVLLGEGQISRMSRALSDPSGRDSALRLRREIAPKFSAKSTI